MQFREGQFVRQSDSDSEKKKGGELEKGEEVCRCNATLMITASFGCAE